MDGTRNDSGGLWDRDRSKFLLESDTAESTSNVESRDSRPFPTESVLRRRRGAVRGVALLLASFAALVGVFYWTPDSSTAQNDAGAGEPDFPNLFQSIDRRLAESYLDLNRIEPQPLIRKALSALELSADEIYVEDSDPSNPYIPVHVGEKTQVFRLKKSMTRREAVALLESVFHFLQLYYHGEHSLNELRYAAANGYLSGIDPHTLVFTPKGFEEFEVHIRGEIFGVGMLVGTNEIGRLEVKQVIKETPAFKAGFKKGDLIAKIDDLSTINMTVMEAVQKIRGPRQSEVVLTVKRQVEVEKDGTKTKETKTIPIAVKRDRVEIKSVESKLLSGSSEEAEGIGYIKVTNFDKNTYASLRRELFSLREDNRGEPLKGLVLDLRDNSGGLLTQATKMVDAFLSEGEIVGTAYKKAEPTYKFARLPGTEPDYPIIVLGDQGSASGAEIVIGALQKNNRALVIGTRTFGKGSVQQLQGLPNGAQLKITVSEYLLPGKVSIQETGVVPDILAKAVYLDEDHLDLFPSDNVPTERDYEAHLVSKYKTNEEPSFTLKYLWTDPNAPEVSTNDESSTKDRPSQQERFITGEIRPERDPLVKMALRVLAISGDKLDPKRLLAEKKSDIEALSGQFYEDITERLEKLGIDWEASPPREGELAPKLDLALTRELLTEKSSDEEDPVPVNKLRVTARLTNQGEEPVYRVKGITRSDYYLFEEKEFLFGKVEPGKTVERSVDIRLPYYPRGQESVISLDISDTDNVTYKTGDLTVNLEERPRPAFAYTSKLVNGKGEEVQRLAEGLDAKLVLSITNVGKSTAHKGIAILRNRAGGRVFLKTGRIEFNELEAGKSTEVEFAFETRKAPERRPSIGIESREDDTIRPYDFELAIVDSYSSASLSRDLIVAAAGGEGDDYPNGERFQAPVIDMALLDAKSDAAVTVTDATRVKLRATVHSERGRFQAWATTLALTQKNRDPDKFFYDDSDGQPSLRVDTRVDLVEGLNLVTIVARDENGIQSRRSKIVRKRKSGLP